MPQSKSLQHPASLSCKGQTASISPSSTQLPKHKKASDTGGGYSTREISSIKSICQEHFVVNVKFLALPEKKFKVPESHQAPL